jgi:hypothetical protein
MSEITDMGHSEYFQRLQIPSLERGLPANPALLPASNVFSDRASYGCTSIAAGWKETSRGGGRMGVNLLSLSNVTLAKIVPEQ